MTDPAQPLDPVRLADRSLRCFVCGVIGLFPLLGAPAAFEAFRLFRRTSRETREAWNHPFFFAILVLLWLGLLLAQRSGSWTWALLAFASGLLLLGAIFNRRFRRSSPSVRNPSRLWLYRGLGMAYAAFYLLGGMGALLLASAFK